MFIIKGKYNIAKVMLPTESEIDVTTKLQILSFLNEPTFKNSNIVIMPDCHAGAGACIGLTMTMNDYIIPNIVGVDIGCGVLVAKIPYADYNYAIIDDYIRNGVPLGFNNGKFSLNEPEVSEFFQLEIKDVIRRLNIGMKKNLVSYEKVISGLGSLGGGNHYIEIGKSEKDDYLYVSVHSGSRNFGKRVAEYHQAVAKSECEKWNSKCSTNLEFLLTDSAFGKQYLRDMKIAQRYSSLNRRFIMNTIYECLGSPGIVEEFESIHNYIDLENMIIRKGAIDATEDKKLIIPLNMRDGCIIGTGLGNSAWNSSAPHGAGRVLSRSRAKKELTMEEFESEMKDVFSTSIKQSTLDESPMAYKDMDLIIESISSLVKIEDIIKPVYNLKDDSKKRKR